MADLLLNKINGDLLVLNGDFVIGDTTYQEVSDILLSNQGDWKQYPTVGIGLGQYQKSNINGLDAYARKQLNGDGITIDNLQIYIDVNGELQVNCQAHR